MKIFNDELFPGYDGILNLVIDFVFINSVIYWNSLDNTCYFLSYVGV